MGDDMSAREFGAQYVEIVGGWTDQQHAEYAARLSNQGLDAVNAYVAGDAVNAYVAGEKPPDDDDARVAILTDALDVVLDWTAYIRTLFGCGKYAMTGILTAQLTAFLEAIGPLLIGEAILRKESIERAAKALGVAQDFLGEVRGVEQALATHWRQQGMVAE